MRDKNAEFLSWYSAVKEESPKGDPWFVRFRDKDGNLYEAQVTHVIQDCYECVLQEGVTVEQIEIVHEGYAMPHPGGSEVW